MARRHRKIITQPERLKWLQQLDSGVGITEIAQKATRDIRLVKQHIELAREEVQIANVKREYLLGRLQEHQEDLLNEVRRIRKTVSVYPPEPMKPDEPFAQKIYAGLIEHLKTKQIVRLVSTYEKMVSEFHGEKQRIEKEMSAKESEILETFSGMVKTNPWVPGIMNEVITGLPKQGEPSASDYVVTNLKDGRIEIRHQSFNLLHSPVLEQQKDLVIKAHVALVSLSNSYQPVFGQFRQRLEAVVSPLSEELEVLLIRRLIPGHCLYCPIR